MSMRYLGGFITASYNPLEVPNPPTIDTATPGNAQVSVAFTAPSNVGGSAITSFVVLVTDSSSGATFTNSGAASPIVVTGLTNGNTYTAKVLAVNSYGPSAFSAPSGGFIPVANNLYSWGLNSNGQLGLNDTANRSSPVQVGSLADWSQLASTHTFSAAVKTNATLWAWGYNNVGQLGQNNTTGRLSPVQIGALTDWAQVAGGGSTNTGFCVAIKTNGTLWSWGDNGYGQLGQNTGNSFDRSSPVQVGALTDWAQISAGLIFCAAIKTNGTLWTWGFNGQGQLGQGTGYGTNRSSPVQVGALTDWLRVSTGNNFCAAIKTNGTLWTWGDGSSGRTGQDTLYNSSSPVQIGALTDWSRVSGGNAHCVAVKTNGTLWAWGANSFGQLGQNNTTYRSSPVQAGALTDWAQVSAGQYFCAAIKTNGTLWTWGTNASGRLGQNRAYSDNQSSPGQVGSLTKWSRISQGSYARHALAILN